MKDIDLHAIVSKLDKIDSKLDKLDTRVDNIDVTLGKQEVQLAEHMRRSLANEEAVSVIKDELKPVVSHVYLMGVLGKIALVILGSGAVGKLISLLMAQ
jgi:hypothetical protein